MKKIEMHVPPSIGGSSKEPARESKFSEKNVKRLDSLRKSFSKNQSGSASTDDGSNNPVAIGDFH